MTIAQPPGAPSRASTRAGGMGHAKPKSVSRSDDDAEFCASFVLSQEVVDDALEEAAISRGPALAVQASPTRKALLYAGLSVGILVVIAVALLAF